MKIAALQMVSTPDVARNLDVAARLVAEAAGAGAQLAALPEYFCLLARDDRDKLAIAEAPGAGPIQQTLAALAGRHGLWLIGGTLPIVAGAAAAGAGAGRGARVRNRCCVYAPDGREAAHYDKLHLFAFDNGRESYDEGRTLLAGAEPVALDCAGWRVGLSICYDLRFPELYRALMRPPCDLIVVPSAFTHTTGRAHWELLLRARAVENQCYVLAPAQGGAHENGRRTWGHSLVADPWGEVLACRAEGEGVVLAEIDRARLDEVRRQLPALAHRRL
ncbi:MAG: hydrolase [Pseudomonadota bacterium]|nr:carbon-nitrogen hydrolase family protein [Rubrivivax sp.]